MVSPDQEFPGVGTSDMFGKITTPQMSAVFQVNSQMERYGNASKEAKWDARIKGGWNILIVEDYLLLPTVVPLSSSSRRLRSPPPTLSES